MTPLKHPLCNSELGSPTGAPPFPKVHVQRYEFEGVPITASFWKPSAVELEELAAGGCIALHVMGATHAPIRVRTQPAATADTLRTVDGSALDLRAPWLFPDRSRT